MSGTGKQRAMLIVAGTGEVNKKQKRHRKHGHIAFERKKRDRYLDKRGTLGYSWTGRSQATRVHTLAQKARCPGPEGYFRKKRPALQI